MAKNEKSMPPKYPDERPKKSSGKSTTKARIEALPAPEQSKKNQALNEFLQRKLSKDGRVAFRKLCDLGCDFEILGGLLMWLSLVEDIKTSENKIPIRPLDSYKIAFNGYDLQELKDIAESA